MENLELMREGKTWNIYWDNETNRWILKSEYWEQEYIFGMKKQMLDMWRQLERVKTSRGI